MQVTLAGGYKPHKHQVRFHESGARFAVVCAGVRGGKSYAATVEFVWRIFEDLKAGKGKEPAGVGRRRSPRLLYWIVSPTMALAKIPYRYLTDIVPHELIQSRSDSEWSIWLKPDILIEVKSGERPDLLVGAGVNGMLIDEGARLKAEAWRGSLRSRLTDTKGWMLCATSPFGGKNSWVYEELVSRADLDSEIGSFSWRTIDNPYIDPEEVVAAQKQLPDAWFRRDYLADWASFGGSVFSEFNEELHVISDSRMKEKYGVADLTPLFRRIVAGVDFGYTSPGAIVVVGIFGDNRFVVLEESYAPNRRMLGGEKSWYSEAMRLKKRWGISLFVCDPSEPGLIMDLQTNGIPTIGANNDILQGISRLAMAMHPVDNAVSLTILDSCVNLRREIRDYSWKRAKNESGFQEIPADNQSDHAIDALRYAVMELRPYVSMTKRGPSLRGPIM